MAISNLKVNVDKRNVTAGDTVRFTISWEGDANYVDSSGKTWIGKYLTISGASQWNSIRPITQSYYDGRSYSFDYKIPDNWVGTCGGWFTVIWSYYDGSIFRTAEVKPTGDIYVFVDGVLKPTVTLTPTDPVIYPGQSATFSVNISGVEPPFRITNYKWIYSLNPIGGNTPTITIPFDNIGYEYCHCEVTIEKNGYATATARGNTRLTMAKGQIEDASVMISMVATDIKIFDDLKATVNVSGVPAGAKAYYSWMLDDVKIGTFDVLTYMPVKTGKFDLKLITNIVGPDYEAKLIESPPIPVEIRKLNVNDLIPKVDASDGTSWGPDGKTRIDWVKKYYIRSNPNFITFNPDFTAGTGVVKVNGKDEPTLSLQKDNDQYYTDFTHLWPDLVGNNTISTEITFKEDEYFTGGTVLLESSVECNKYAGRKYFFMSDKGYIQPGSIFYIDAKPDTSINFNIRNLLDNTKDASQDYLDAIEELSYKGVYQLINKDGEVEVTANGNNFSYKVPAEVKKLVGKIRHTIDDPSIFANNPYIVEQDIVIDITPNQMIPMPTIDIIQTPNPVRLGSDVVFSRKFNNLPAGSNIDGSEWLINGSVQRSGDELSGKAELSLSHIKNTTDVIPTIYYPATVVGTIVPTVLLKEWPAITLDVIPAKTVVKWGEKLIAGYDVIGKEDIEDISKLIISKPTWYMDNNKIDTLAEDGSLNVDATHPGEHVMKAIVTLVHPDYENGQLTIEKTFNMTTEKREMATVLKLMPTDAVVGIGKTQKFTATVTGAPVDAVTTYVWTVDGLPQSSTTNTMDYKANEVGTNTIKVVSTTKAQDAEDDIQEATVTMTVNKNVMAVTVLASSPLTSIKLGETYSVKCDVTGQPTGATIAYKWNSGETTQSITGTGSALGPISRKCTVTVKATDYEDSVSDSNTVTITVQKKTQTTTASISTATPTIKQDEMYEAGVAVSGAPGGATITYLWSTGETTQNITKKQHTAGQVKLSCKVTVKHADYEDKIIDTNEVTITVQKVVVPGVVVDISADSVDVEINTEYTLTVKVTGQPAGSTVTYLWNSGETGPSIKHKQSADGDYKHDCKVTVKHADYDDFVVDKTITVKVTDSTPVVPDECPVLYIHPLPHRMSAYIWCGWWVMDAIQKLTTEGKDWKKATEADTKYYCHLATLAKMITDYPEVDVQESRNGYIVHKSALDAGIIY